MEGPTIKEQMDQIRTGVRFGAELQKNLSKHNKITGENKALIASEIAVDLIDIERKVKMLDVKRANGVVTEDEYDNRMERFLGEAEDAADRLSNHIIVHHSGDPRGVSLWIIFPHHIPNKKDEGNVHLDLFYNNGVPVPSFQLLN